MLFLWVETLQWGPWEVTEAAPGAELLRFTRLPSSCLPAPPTAPDLWSSLTNALKDWLIVKG